MYPLFVDSVGVPWLIQTFGWSLVIGYLAYEFYKGRVAELSKEMKETSKQVKTLSYIALALARRPEAVDEDEVESDLLGNGNAPSDYINDDRPPSDDD